MALLYDVFYFAANGRHLAECDFDSACPRVDRNGYTQHVNTNWDRHIYWYDPDGNPISYDALPWVIAAKKAEAAARRQAEADAWAAECDFWRRATRDICARDGDVSVVIRGIDGVKLRVTSFLAGKRIGEGTADLATFREAVTQWSGVPAVEDVRGDIYRLLATMLPQ
jgi:hypothetical protein